MSAKDVDTEQEERRETAFLRKAILSSREFGLQQMMQSGRRAFGEPRPDARAREQNIHQALKYLIVQRYEDTALPTDGASPLLSDLEGATELLPVRVYLPKEDRALEQKLLSAMEQLSEALGLDVVLDFREVRRSWFKTWIMKFGRFLSTPEVAERLQKVERAIELKGLDIPQSQVDAKQAHAVSELLRALARTPEALVQIGALVIVKHPSVNGGVVCVRTLTPDIMDRLESDPSLLSQSTNFLKILEHLPRRTELVSLGGEVNNGPPRARKTDKRKSRKRPTAGPGLRNGHASLSARVTVEKGSQPTDAVGTDQNVAAAEATFRGKKKKNPDELEKL